MNRSYRTVWKAALDACVAAAENVGAPRGRARGSRGANEAGAALALATLAVSGAAQAATFTASNEAELITAINAANASTDPSSTITLSAAITVSSAVPALHGNVTLTTNANLATTIGSAVGASLDLQAGAHYVGNGLLGRVLVGNTINTTGTLTMQGRGTTLSTISLRGQSGQSSISVLDGAVLTITSGTGSGVYLGGTSAGNNGGGTAKVVVSGEGSAINTTQYLQQAGTLEISDRGSVQASSAFYLGAMTGRLTGLVTGAGSTLATGATLALGANGSATLTVADGGTISAGQLVTLAGALGTGTGSGSATLNIGAPVGDAPVAPGTVIATAIQGGAGTAVVNFNHDASAYDFSVPITANVNVNQVGSGTTTFTVANTYTGATNVTAGSLRAGAANVFSPASAHAVAAGGTLDLAGFNQTLSSLRNAGIVSLPGSTPGNTLTVAGPYVGDGGTLRVSIHSGVSDRLVLSGATAIASGTTRVQVTNPGALGALTTGDGIEVISALNGATTTAQTTRSAFALAGGHIDAGAYEYRLYAADASGAGENWYLRSSAIPTAASPAGTVPAPTYRTEVPLYAVLPEQFRELDIAMLGNLHQRAGDERAAAGDASGERQAWGRIVSVDRDIAQQGTVSPSSSGRLTGFQAGTDLWANASWRAGLYAGQLEGDMDVSGFARGVVNYAAGRNNLRSQYLGAYATWSRDGSLYIDGVLQAGRHRYTAYPSLGPSSSGKGDSLVASLEVGQGFALAPGWVIEPQVQIAYQHLSLDDTAVSGATIHQEVDGGWIARAGVRVKGAFDAGPGTLQPYARLNLYKRSSGTDITRFISAAAVTDIATRTGGSSSELAVGATWHLNKSTSLYTEVGRLWDLGGDARTGSGINGSAGVKVLW
ncbi:MAG: autotransporter outer membrane beta-barrel domain-containing protein [Variovorax sp.]|nr:autotransporter outer membrane beta-barrel domain-containing protein [Variovorax sp.]